jgi:hypothetical protein
MMARPSPAQRLLQLSLSNKLVLAEALLCLSAASVAIKLLPFRRTARMMRIGSREAAPDPLTQGRAIAQCRWAVCAWADRVPWKAVCFQRGLALHLMLRRRGILSVLHYGIAQDEKLGLRAHVWIGVGDRLVLGGEEAAQFARVASFPSPQG